MTNTRETIRRLNEDVFGDGRIDLIDEIVHEDYVDHTPQEGVPADRDGLKAFVQAIHGALSDARAELERIVVDGDEVAWRWSMHGKHTGEFMGIPPTGNTIEITGNDFGVMRDGKLAELWAEMDNLSLMTQLGVVDQPVNA